MAAIPVPGTNPGCNCEVCPNEVLEAEDLAMNDEINRTMGDEIRTQAAYT